MFFHILDSLAYQEFRKIAMKTRWLNDVRMMSTSHQTSSLESYHNVINTFCPKSTHFEYPSMIIR